MTARRRERGTSAIEMVVTLAIVTVVLLAGTSAITQLLRQAAREGSLRPRVGGETDVALDAMERDLREAVDLPHRMGERRASAGTLLVALPSGDGVAYELRGRRLVRIVVPFAGPERERVVADGVTLADFRQRTPHVRDLVLRREGEHVRQRSVLLRNVGRGGAP